MAVLKILKIHDTGYRMASRHDVFGEPALLGPPVKRAAYSDRTSLLMAEMSKLAYIRFEDPPDPDGDHQDEINRIVQEIKNADDEGQARDILATYVRVAPAAVRKRSEQDLRAELAKGGFELFNTYAVGETQAFLAVKEPSANSGPGEEGIAVLSFRGTEGTMDWKTNLNAFKEIVDGVPIHTGFLRAFRLVKTDIKMDLDQLSTKGYALYLTGHSLGGALALIATKEIAHASIGACYTFGSPRVAGFGFARNIKTPIYRVVNARDIVPRVPPVFLPTVLSVVVSFTLIPYQKWISKILKKFTGYVHHGDMRYLTRTKKERSYSYEDVKLLANPNMVYRAIWWFRGIWRKPGSPIDDHSIDTYCKKLKTYALRRINQPNQ